MTWLVEGTTGRPPDVEVEPWDEPDEGEKLRASAKPPESAERKALSRFRPHTLVEAKELLPLAEFTSKHEFLHQAQRRFTTVVHNRNWRDLAMELAEEGSAGSRSAPRGKKGKARAEGRERAKHAAWREAVRFVAASQDGAGAFLNAIPMRDDMRMDLGDADLGAAPPGPSPRRGLPGRGGGQEDSEQEDPRRVRRRCCQRAAAEPQHQTQVCTSAPHPRPTRRVGHRCANGAESPPRSELQQTTRRGRGQHWLARHALLRRRQGRLFPQQQRGARSEGRFCRFRGNTEAFYRNMVYQTTTTLAQGSTMLS